MKMNHQPVWALCFTVINVIPLDSYILYSITDTVMMNEQVHRFGTAVYSLE
ncbi:hypothetical protein [Pradoshia eiseniae]|uniref:hypothetical protein n=1 Tax=Pradoshia eiseniae TaxID=2064768 RepID=UPI00137505E0|nr:hypothetical protein [Pradoshia eiseniae]